MAKSAKSVLHSETVSIFLSELLGTAILVFFGCSGCLEWTENANVDHLKVVLTFGFAVLIAIQIFGCVSGAHINPAVTVAALIYNIIDFKLAIIYVIAQCVGAFMGYGLLISVSPEVALKASGPSFCVTKPSELITTQQAFCVEFVATATLIWFVCGIWDPRNAKHQESVSIRFALAVAGLASATADFSGGSLNPARSLGPVLWTGDYEEHWMYWLAPLSGATVAAIVYKHVFRREIIQAEDFGQNLETLGEAASKA